MTPGERPAPGTPPDAERLATVFVELSRVIARLRSPDGCPWDRKQTLKSIKPYTLEETYELLEAIDSGETSAIVEELGDVLLQVVLDAQIGADAGEFGLIEVIEQITRKMVRRHPHVFGSEQAENVEDVSRHWHAAKNAEKSERQSIFDGIPAALPQLARAARISKKAARAGYDFPRREMLFDKLQEELRELAVELFDSETVPRVVASIDPAPVPDEAVTDEARKQRIEGELGDVLFVVANIARRWGIDPEEALRSSNRKFEQRVKYIEAALATSGRRLEDVPLAEMEALYQQGKREERSRV
ncbi:MAG: nucleoside triphosphate pyrophosphohydrolase [Planctomycetaceae bacterium]|nr:nucleoside triphosphate pyrophosphohydrolase [Planctomycetaceae bacterium]